MIIDFHTHIFPPAFRQQRQRLFDREPAFELLYRSPMAKTVSATELVATMDDQAVDRSVVFGFPWQNPDTARRHNDYILEAVGRYPDRLTGFCCLDPAAAGAGDEVERCLAAGLKGVGELAFYRSGIDARALDRLAPVMDLCRRRKLPVLIHTNEPVGHAYPGKTPNTLAQIYALAKRFADNTIVLAHWGGGIFFYHLLRKEVAETLKNVYFDTAASPYLYRPDIYRIAAELAGPAKLLFGSDFPLIRPARYFAEIDSAGLTAVQREALCGGNAARLLGLDGPCG